MADEELKEENTPTEEKEEPSKKSKKNQEDRMPGEKGNAKKDGPIREDLPESKAKDRKALKMRKEWADEIVSNKKVRREEARRKLKKAMLFVLTFSVIITSVVYIMLLFIQENNVRITAKSSVDEKSISLSMDNEYWTPYLNSKGPDQMWDLSYSREYEREEIRHIDEVKALLSADEIKVGDMHGDKYICFVFMLRNSGSLTATVDYAMTVESDGGGLDNAVRVMWGESFKSKLAEGVDPETNIPYEPTVDVYARLSYDEKLANTSINVGRTIDDGFIEYTSYPLYSTSFENVHDYEQNLNVDDKLISSVEKQEEALNAGFFATTPFASEELVFERQMELKAGDIMYAYVCIWLEGSDYECIDNVLGSSCKIGVEFYAH